MVPPELNLTADDLEAWLGDPRHRLASGKTGWRSLRRLAAILRKVEQGRNLTGPDYDHLRDARNFIRRHTAQATFGDPVSPHLSRRHIALRNWGHDVTRPESPAYRAHERWTRWHYGRDRDGVITRSGQARTPRAGRLGWPTRP
jgi:hypothetical protein